MTFSHLFAPTPVKTPKKTGPPEFFALPPPKKPPEKHPTWLYLPGLDPKKMRKHYDFIRGWWFSEKTSKT
jgi:hypothetical protein